MTGMSTDYQLKMGPPMKYANIRIINTTGNQGIILDIATKLHIIAAIIAKISNPILSLLRCIIVYSLV